MWFEETFKDLFKREIPKNEVEAFYQREDLDSFFGKLNNYWNPGELIRKIGGVHNLEKLYKDSEIYAAVDKRIAAIRDTRLVLEGESDELVKFFENQILPFEDQLKQDFWWSIPYGYSVEQIIYDPDKSCKVIGFQKEDFWRFEPLQDLIHVKLISTTNNNLRNKVLPYGKWVLTTNNGTNNNPSGDAMFERLIMPWIFRCNGWDLWMDFAKRFANGFMHAKLDDPSKMLEFRKQLEKAAKSAVIVTDKSSELNLIQANRDSSIFEAIDSKTTATIQKVILGETLTSDMQVRGSSGASSIHNLVREEKSKADVRLIESAINETIMQIAAVCGITNESLPKAKIIYDPGLNEELANRDQVLSGVGVKFNKKYFINNYGLRDDEFEVVETQPQPQLPFSQNKQSFLSSQDIKSFIGESNHQCQIHLSEKPNNSKINRRINRQSNEKEEIVTFLNKKADGPLDIDDVIAAIEISKNQKELDENLIKLFDHRNNKFVDTMTETLYYAAAKGALLGNPKKLKKEDIKE